jgi:hypothetical protein
VGAKRAHLELAVFPSEDHGKIRKPTIPKVLADMSRQDSTKNAVNEPGSSGKTDTPVTRERSAPVRSLWVVRDHDDNIWGPFDNGGTASEWAKKKWPGIAQWQEGIEQDECWDVEALWLPD